MEMRTVMRTNVGRVRKVNEDAAYIGDTFCIVCDGMGGHKAGDVASNLAVDVVSLMLTGKEPSVGLLLKSVASANERVHKKAAEDPSLSGMGTTLTSLWIDDGQCIIAQVGDSRAYLLRDGSLRQCTHDHSLVAELVRTGAITQEEARVHPQRNLVTRALGTDSHVVPDIFEIAREKGDRWLLCSDGLTTHVPDAEICRLLQIESLYDAADALLEAALTGGGTDNITLVILHDEGGEA